MKRTRRDFLTAFGASAVGMAAASKTLAQEMGANGAYVGGQTRINTSSYRTQFWQDHFDNLNNGVILVDIPARTLHYWNEGQTIYRVYPIAVPLTDDFARYGYTTVTQKVDGPSWSPTTSMLERDPTLPRYVGPGPENPLGTHALYLGWQYYRIHGNNDQRKIGRQSSNGCIGLYNEHIRELFGMARVGTQVKVI